jgi:hypothetical protein
MKQGLIVLRRIKNAEYQMRLVHRIQEFLIARTERPAENEQMWRELLRRELDRAFELICRNDGAL